MLNRIREVAEQALAGGQLRPIRTFSTWCEDAGMTFLIRQVASLASKPHARAQDWPTAATATPAASTGTAETPNSPPGNPFLPYDPAMFVTDVSPTHVALLNKFPVVADHLLVVTRQFELQNTRLSEADFAALAHCQWQYPSLGFYNSGTIAGASQPHRHLQLIPLPLAERAPDLPLDALLCQVASTPSQAERCEHIPFEHRWIGIPHTENAAELGRHFAQAYDLLLESLGWLEITSETSYNLLATRQWMMVVPRRAESYLEISLNAMAYIGALLVRTRAELEQLRAAGPMAALIATAGLRSD